MRRLFTNARILPVTSNGTQISQGWLAIEGEVITGLGEGGGPDPGDYELVEDCQGDILMPGFINCHTHIGLIPFRGLGEDMPDRLHRFLFPLETQTMTAELAGASAKYACHEMLANGITTFFDMYYFEDKLVGPVAETGIRAILAETIIDQQIDTEQAFGGLERLPQLIEQASKTKRVHAAIGPHAPYTVDEETLVKIKSLSDQADLLWSIHLHEMDFEMADFDRKYQQTPLAWMASQNLVNDRFIAAHCIHMTEEDIELLAKFDSRVAHCPNANMKSGKGIAPVKDMRAAGVRVGLGTDGPISGNTFDFFQLMRVTAMAQKTHYHERDILSAREVVEMATIEGAKVLDLDHLVGSLEVGKQADFLRLSVDELAMYPIYDLYATIVYQAGPANVRNTYVAGRECLNKAKQRQSRTELTAAMVPFLKAYEALS